MGAFYGDVLTNLFFIFGDVLPNSGGGGCVLTRERFDLHNTIQYNTKFIYIVGDTNSITLAMNSYLPT